MDGDGDGDRDRDIEIFCLSFKNDERRKRITELFTKQNLSVRFYEGVDYSTDTRIVGRQLDENTKRCWSIMYGHLDMLQLFVDTGKPVGIFCEDDIIIRKDFSKFLPHIIENFKELSLDVLLLGNLCMNPDFHKYINFPEMFISEYSVHPFRYYAYDSNPESGVWGTQMYVLQRSQAILLLEQYYTEYADRTLEDRTLTPFSADWTITKGGKKALIYPLVAIENNESVYSDLGQDFCRKSNYNLFYSKEIFD
jgi:GR25 family glycosyltransferase involved in LPS biosynthesis